MSRTDDFDRILLAYDGTRRGRVALRRSLPLLGGAASPVHLLAVIPVTGAVAAAEGFYSEQLYEEERERIQTILDDGVALLEEHGVAATGYIRSGQPARQIAQLARELGVDLVVVGHERRGPLARWWQGSVGASLIDLLDCSLLVVQAPDEDEADPD
jgi:nucleotide-binding universal stress UspA family protein